MSAFDEVWIRIQRFAGEPFHKVNGEEFTYSVAGGAVHAGASKQVVSVTAFEEALERMPAEGPGALGDLQGPSYLYAILSDPRIMT